VRRRYRFLLLLAALAAATATAVAAVQADTKKTARPAKQASSHMLIGVYDEGHTFFDDPNVTFSEYARLRPQILRVGLYWGGPLGVAKRRPKVARDPDDPAYDWSLYDRTVQYANAIGVKVLFSITFTPRWANGGQSQNRPPKSYRDLENFAYAAAERYSGASLDAAGRTLPAVRYWLAWNEPNNPVFLRPQYVKKNGKWIIQSAIYYAQICNAIYTGIHATQLAGEKVACGATAPRGNNAPTSSRPSVSPIAFLKAAKNAGMKRMDAYAHHPYYGKPNETPTTKPTGARGAAPTAVTLANIGDLLKAVTSAYGNKPLWITEYGYQTNPPDKSFGVSYAKQAAYLTQAFAIARKNPRIAMMLWFLVKDEPKVSGWQSGLMTAALKAKPSFKAFQRLPRG